MMEKYGMAIDAHCHLEMFDNPQVTVTESLENGLAAIITSGWSLKSSILSSELTSIDGVFASIGVGPEEMPPEGYLEKLEGLAKHNSKIVAIGEIGLDAKAIEKISIDAQKELFISQLDLAESLHMPAVIHSRGDGMLHEIIKILEDKGTAKAMFHFFGGNEEDAKKLERDGYILSIPPLESSRLKRVIRTVDVESLVAETDAPFVGKKPTDSINVVRKISEFKGKGFEDVGFIIKQTIKDYFGIIIKEGP